MHIRHDSNKMFIKKNDNHHNSSLLAWVVFATYTVHQETKERHVSVFRRVTLFVNDLNRFFTTLFKPQLMKSEAENS